MCGGGLPISFEVQSETVCPEVPAVPPDGQGAYLLKPDGDHFQDVLQYSGKDFEDWKWPCFKTQETQALRR